MRIFLLLIMFVTCLQIVAINDTYAASSAHTVQQIEQQFHDKASTIGTALETYAKKIFYWCILLDVVLFGIKATLNQSQINEIISQFIQMLLFAAFCFAVIGHYQEWTKYIINGLGTYADAAGGVNLTTESPLYSGYYILVQVINKCSFSITDPSATMRSLAYIAIAGIIFVIFALMTAMILLVKCESYIAINVSILLIGLGGSTFFKEYAINTMRYAFSVAFKLFTMQIVLAIGIAFIKEFRTISEVDWQSLFILLCCAVILLVLIEKIPEIVAGIINGSHTGSGVGFRAAATAGAAAAGAAVGGAVVAARTGRMVSNAHKIASLEAKNPDMRPQDKKGTWGHLKAALSSGHQDKNGMGSTYQRASSHLKAKLTKIKATDEARKDIDSL